VNNYINLGRMIIFSSTWLQFREKKGAAMRVGENRYLSLLMMTGGGGGVNIGENRCCYKTINILLAV
jgi:hypothetical protein